MWGPRAHPERCSDYEDTCREEHRHLGSVAVLGLFLVALALPSVFVVTVLGGRALLITGLLALAVWVVWVCVDARRE